MSSTLCQDITRLSGLYCRQWRVDPQSRQVVHGGTSAGACGSAHLLQPLLSKKTDTHVRGCHAQERSPRLGARWPGRRLKVVETQLLLTLRA